VREEIQESCQECAIPALLLQPLVENAVKHGIAGLVDGGVIRLSVERSGAEVHIAVENQFDPEAAPPDRLGVGLAHVRRRLQVRYGSEASLLTEAGEGVYRVSLRFPCEPAAGA
jgi:LytS/YehU family sensor histidine kinase